MKILSGMLLVLVMNITAGSAFAQEGCKVLMENICGSYDGECRNHLAQGTGTARGIDTYSGSFRKGYPNGKGLYTWSTGQYYEGEWLMGKREGFGEYHYTLDGKEIIDSGIWKNDRFLGPVAVAHQIDLSQNISAVSFSKTGEGSRVVLKIMMAGMNNSAITDLSVNASSGIEFNYGSYMGFKSVTFPFTCRIRYISPNMMHSVFYNCAITFVIFEPGRWEVKLENN